MDSLKFNTSKNFTDKDLETKDSSLLRIENLNTGYRLSSNKSISLHQEINCKVDKRQLITLLGPNGAGKSTLLKTLVGIIPQLNGHVYYEGKKLSHLSRKEIARFVAIVLTDKIDDKYLRSYDIVGTGRYPYGSFTGKLSNEDNEKILNSLNVVGVTELASRYFHSLSDGEKQKILLARAIAQDTPLILLDEPTAFIDSPGKVIIMNLLNELVVKYNKTILLTTHDTELALRYATRLWLLGKDNYFEVGTPDKMIASGMINRLFDREGVMFNVKSSRFETN